MDETGSETLLVEGALSDEFYLVRQILYGEFRVGPPDRGQDSKQMIEAMANSEKQTMAAGEIPSMLLEAVERKLVAAEAATAVAEKARARAEVTLKELEAKAGADHVAMLEMIESVREAAAVDALNASADAKAALGVIEEAAAAVMKAMATAQAAVEDRDTAEARAAAAETRLQLAGILPEATVNFDASDGHENAVSNPASTPLPPLTALTQPATALPLPAVPVALTHLSTKPTTSAASVLRTEASHKELPLGNHCMHAHPRAMATTGDAVTTKEGVSDEQKHQKYFYFDPQVRISGRLFTCSQLSLQTHRLQTLYPTSQILHHQPWPLYLKP